MLSLLGRRGPEVGDPIQGPPSTLSDRRDGLHKKLALLICGHVLALLGVDALPGFGSMIGKTLIGKTFTRLTVVSEAPKAHRKRRWHCSCSCGGSTTAYQ